jgi:hypothetical protein
MNMDKEATLAALEAALVTSEELDAGLALWKTFDASKITIQKAPTSGAPDHQH